MIRRLHQIPSVCISPIPQNTNTTDETHAPDTADGSPPPVTNLIDKEPAPNALNTPSHSTAGDLVDENGEKVVADKGRDVGDTPVKEAAGVGTKKLNEDVYNAQEDDDDTSSDDEESTRGKTAGTRGRGAGRGTKRGGSTKLPAVTKVPVGTGTRARGRGGGGVGRGRGGVGRGGHGGGLKHASKSGEGGGVPLPTQVDEATSTARDCDKAADAPPTVPVEGATPPIPKAREEEAPEGSNEQSMRATRSTKRKAADVVAGEDAGMSKEVAAPLTDAAPGGKPPRKKKKANATS